MSTLDREALKPNTSIALHRHSHSVVDILPPESDSTVQLMSEKPNGIKEVKVNVMKEEQCESKEIITELVKERRAQRRRSAIQR